MCKHTSRTWSGSTRCVRIASMVAWAASRSPARASGDNSRQDCEWMVWCVDGVTDEQ